MSINHHTSRSLTFIYAKKKPTDELNRFLNRDCLPCCQYFSSQGSKKDLTDIAILSGINIEVQQWHL